MSIPTKITISRIMLIPLFIIVWYLPYLGELTFLSLKSLVLTSFFILLSLTDWVDGYIARKYNMITDLGKFLDPIADKVLVFTIYFLLLYNQIIDPISVTLMMSREFIVAAVRMVAATDGVVIAADWSGKVKTVIQMISLVLFLLCLEKSSQVANVIVISVYWLSVLLTMTSGYFYTTAYIKGRRGLK
ncbi:MAG: CDP-diacylglycerol--glycerol-3-phosphate 3-phosphatidyltransferase [Culicoidibacterales bacterium]